MNYNFKILSDGRLIYPRGGKGIGHSRGGGGYREAEPGVREAVTESKKGENRE